MDICFVPSLEHLASSKFITLLINGASRLQKEPVKEQYDWYTLRVKNLLSKHFPPNCLKRKVESFITPILCEPINWADNYQQCLCTENKLYLPLNNVVQQCWLSDGTIDREKWAKIFFKNSNASPLNRFAFACVYCMPEDILNQWEMLSRIEKAFFRHKRWAGESHSIVRSWVEWLDSSANKDWESCVAWILETPLWKRNLCILRRVLQTLSPAERSVYLLQVLCEKYVTSDVMKFGLQILSREERLIVFKESPVQVFKCILSWPLRGAFMKLVDNLWPHITAATFCDILVTILSMIIDEERDYIDLLIILKSFWAESPGHCKNTAVNDRAISKPLNYVLNCEFSIQFNREVFLEQCVNIRRLYPHVFRLL